MKKKTLALLLCLVMLVTLFAGCSKESSSQTDKTAENTTSESTSGSTSGNSSSDTSGKSSGETSGKKYKIGFANIGEVVELQLVVKESVMRAAEEAGVDLVYMNNNLDGATAVKNADNMIQQGIDGFIEFNIDESVGPSIKEKMDAAGIPIIAVDIAIPDCVFFGANNETAGYVGGVRLGEVAKKRWNQEPDILLLVYDSTSGETPMARVTKMPDGIRSIFPDFSDDKVVMIDGGSDAASAQKAVSDFLSAHPNEHRIAIGCYHDLYATATLAAIETAGRDKDCIMVAANEYGYLDYIKENPEPSEDECFVGGVAFFFNRYGDYLIPAMIDLLDGKDVPEKIFVEHEVITRENAEKYYADYLKK